MIDFESLWGVVRLYIWFSGIVVMFFLDKVMHLYLAILLAAVFCVVFELSLLQYLNHLQGKHIRNLERKLKVKSGGKSK